MVVVASNSCNPMDCSLPGSSVHGIPQARILEWAAMPSSRGLSRLRDWTQVSLCFLQPLSIGLQRVGQDCSDLACRHASEKAHILPVECVCLLLLDYGSLFNSFLCETKDLHLVAHSRNSPEISCAPFYCSLFTKNIDKSIPYLLKKEEDDECPKE